MNAIVDVSTIFGSSAQVHVGDTNQIETENIELQNAAIAANGFSELSPGSFGGSLLSSTTAFAAAVTQDLVLKQDLDVLKKDVNGHAAASSILNDLRKVTGDFIGLLGDGFQMAGAATAVNPRWIPITCALKGAGTITSILGLTISSPDYVAAVAQAGFNALSSSSQNTVHKIESALSNYLSSNVTSFSSAGTQLENFASSILGIENELSQPISDSTIDQLSNDETAVLNNWDNYTGAYGSFINSSGLLTQNVNITTTSGKETATVGNNSFNITDGSSNEFLNDGLSTSFTYQASSSTGLQSTGTGSCAVSPNGTTTLSTSYQSGTDSASQFTQTDAGGIVVEQDTTYDGIKVNTPASGSVYITTNPSGVLVADVTFRIDVKQ